ncbi:hypothetical protein ACJA88_012129 [Fusarium oxysporum]
MTHDILNNRTKSYALCTSFQADWSASYSSPSKNREMPFDEVQQWVKKRVDKKAAIQDGTHMVGMQGYGDLCETPQSVLDFWVAKERGENPDRVEKVHTFVMVPRGYLIYLEELTKARRRGEIEREVVALQEKAREKFYPGLNGIMRSEYRYKINRLEKELVEIQAIGGHRYLNK